MKPKFILCLALVMSGGLFGCSTNHHATAIEQINSLPLYVHFGFEDGNSAKRFLSTRIHLDETFFVGGDDYLELKGHVDRRGINLVADLMGSTGEQSQFYRGNVTLEKPFFAQGGAASGGAGPPYWFILSTNSDSRAIVDRIDAGMGFTNAPVNHSAAVQPSPLVITNVPTQIDPATGLPADDLLVNPTSGFPGSSSVATPPQTIKVSVSGWVKAPGDHVLPKGAGIVAALEAAGGFKDSGHSSSLLVVRMVNGEEKKFSVRLHNDSGKPTADFEVIDGDAIYAREVFF